MHEIGISSGWLGVGAHVCCDVEPPVWCGVVWCPVTAVTCCVPCMLLSRCLYVPCNTLLLLHAAEIHLMPCAVFVLQDFKEAARLSAEAKALAVEGVCLLV